MKKLIILTSVFLVLLVATAYKAVVPSPSKLPKEDLKVCQYIPSDTLDALLDYADEEGLTVDIYPIKKTKNGSSDFEIVTVYRNSKGKLVRGIPYPEDVFRKYTANYMGFLKKKRVKKSDIPHGYQMKVDKEVQKCLYVCFTLNNMEVKYTMQCESGSMKMYALKADSATGKCPPCARLLFKEEVVGKVVQTTFK